MKWVWVIGNGVTVISAVICISYLYRFRWSDSKTRLPVWSLLIITITVVITSFQFVFPELLAAFRRNLDSLLAGEWWRMVTPLFVQPYGWFQCFSNAFFLLAFVPLAEKLYGKGVLALYFIPGIVGQLVNYAWSPDGGGSSTAAFGVMGGLFVYLCRYRKEVPTSYFLFAIIGLCAAGILGLVKDGHGPALLIGALVAIMLKARQLPIAIAAHDARA
ncbi:MAG: rhomboid family intramembrane serine protease [Pseudomonadota bacterium]